MQRRERYRLEGPTTFGDAELVALMLGTGMAGHSSLQIAATLLDAFGGLAGVSARDPRELMAIPGIGEERAVRLHASLEAGRRAQVRALHTDPITNPIAAWRALEPGLRGLPHEELHALFLDRRRRPVARRRLTRGSEGFTVVDPRQVFRVALQVGAHAVIVAHNHPSGDPEPSDQDVKITNRLTRAGVMLGIPLLDHLVVGADTFRSLAEQGALCSWAPCPAWAAEGDRP